MDLPSSPPPDRTEKELALILFRAGVALKGRNLRKTSWGEIATFVASDGPLQHAMWRRLRGADTRDDALRVLRIIRKQSQWKSRGSSRLGSRGEVVRRELAADWQSESEIDECWDYHDPWCWYPWQCDDDEWWTVEERFAHAATQALNECEHTPTLELLPSTGTNDAGRCVSRASRR